MQVSVCDTADIGAAINIVQLHLAKLQAAAKAGRWHECGSAFRAIGVEATHGGALAASMVSREREGGGRERAARL